MVMLLLLWTIPWYSKDILTYSYPNWNTHDFGVDFHEVDKRHSGNKNIHARDQLILMNFDKSLIEIDLMYVPIW